MQLPETIATTSAGPRWPRWLVLYKGKTAYILATLLSVACCSNPYAISCTYTKDIRIMEPTTYSFSGAVVQAETAKIIGQAATIWLSAV